MPDMLVHLLKLPALQPTIDSLASQGVTIRRARPFEIGAVRAFIEEQFSVGWADEVEPCYSRQPITLFIATRAGRVIGFAAYEATMRGFFGPTGVMEAERGKDIGKALLLASLWGMREMGYAYGVIAGVGPAKFYAKVCGATLIPGSTPGIYTDRLKAAPMPD
jgi:predicted N-acetyltransferase YhbS